MNFNKVGLLILFFILGIISFGSISFLLESSSSIIYLFLIGYLVAIFFTIREFSTKRLIITISFFVVCFIIMLIPWGSCTSYSGEYSTKGFIEGGAYPFTKKCSCIGFEKKIAVAGGGPYTTYASQCIGIPTNFKCYYGAFEEEEISCKEAGFD